MKLIPGYLLILLFISTPGFSQTKKYLYYFDTNLNTTTPTKAVIFGIGLNDNNTIQLKCFNNATKKLIFINHYTDSSLKTMQGLFQSYYSNGYQESEGNYLNGKEEGIWEKWDTAGNIIDSSIFEKGERNLRALFSYDTNSVLRSFVLYDFKNPAVDRAVYYNEKGNIIDPATIVEKDDKIFFKTEIEASFPGGEGAWTRYVMEQIRSNFDYLIAGNNSGTCRVKFIVDKLGNVTNAEAITMQGTRLAKVAISAITKGPRWTPALQNGRPVNAYREQPITFTMQNN